MERLAVVIALIVAGVFALHAIAPQGVFMYHSDDIGFMDEEASPVDAALIQNVAETVFEGSELRIADAAVRIDVIPEDRDDFAISITNSGPLATPSLRAEGGVVTVDGGLNGRISCRGEGGVVVHGRGAAPLDRLPVVQVRAPRDLAIATQGGGGFLRIGDTTALRAAFSGCGDAEIGAVREALQLRVDGSGDVRVAAAQDATLSLAGSGDVAVAGGVRRLQVELDGSSSLDVETVPSASAVLGLNGSGDIDVRGGPLASLNAVIDGSGSMTVEGDVTGEASARINGSGDIEISGVAGALNATIEGSGGIEVGGVHGRQTRVVHGSGRIDVGYARADEAAAPPPPARPAPPLPPAVVEAPATGP
jgi:hypothetical protein